ncbi:hypothetical protein BS47DRAFT_1339668, partial [Hydnum rufescens UP504]
MGTHPPRQTCTRHVFSALYEQRDLLDNLTQPTAAGVVPWDERTPYKTSLYWSNLSTHSWRRPGMYNVSDLCSYIASTPTTYITHLKWCKDRKGVKHEFLVLRVERPQDKPIWLRLDRRLHQHAPVVEWIFSTSPTGDSVRIHHS